MPLRERRLEQGCHQHRPAPSADHPHARSAAQTGRRRLGNCLNGFLEPLLLCQLNSGGRSGRDRGGLRAERQELWEHKAMQQAMQKARNALISSPLSFGREYKDTGRGLSLRSCSPCWPGAICIASRAVPSRWKQQWATASWPLGLALGPPCSRRMASRGRYTTWVPQPTSSFTRGWSPAWSRNKCWARRAW
jgi:hypothetical protein